eukprot:TRINITY_DN992_c0_g3_i1.p1 TRINITY_DN992_c0_g3~~TRINITY_DN992_c0_g3_i1.p1  ORF type:complete len:150 (+),score=38.43 TRINITY_DN992_c0_g3_i1:45-452(+)
MRKLDKVLTVVVSLSALLNIGAGIAAFILYISSGKVAESFLGAYLAFFGLAQLFSQMKSEGKTSSKLIRNNFGFMTTWFGLGIFLLFVGSLGLSFNWGDATEHWFPFLSGCITAGVAILCFIRSCVSSKDYEEIA